MLQASGKPESAAKRGQLYRDYVHRAGLREAERRLERADRAERIEQMMHVGVGRKRRGIKRQQRNQTPTFDCGACKGLACRIVDAPQACMVCTRCGVCETFLDLTEAAMPFGTLNTTPSSEYRRLNHFTELLAQAQGKEKAEVPEQVIERVRREIEAHGIKDPALITRARVRRFLKQIKCIKVPCLDEAKAMRIPWNPNAQGRRPPKRKRDWTAEQEQQYSEHCNRLTKTVDGSR